MSIFTIKMPQDKDIKYESFRYPAGEIQVRLKTEAIDELRQADEVHVWATIKNGEIMELALLTSALGLSSNILGQKFVLILPYLPYGRADRRFTNTDCNGLATFTSAILDYMSYDEVITLDGHSHKAEDFGIQSISPMPIIKTVIEQLTPVTILLPDEGASRYGLKGLHCRKQRDPITGKLSGFEVPPKESFATRNVLIVDDICDGGGTFLGIARQMKDYGLNLNLYVSHGIFSKGLLELTRWFDHIYTTDSFITDKTSLAFSDSLTIIPSGGTVLASLLKPSDLWKIK